MLESANQRTRKPRASSGTKSQSAAATRTRCRPRARPTRKFRARATRKNSSPDFAAGMGRVAGESGCFAKLTRDCFLIAGEMMREKSWTALLAPLGLL